MMNYKYPRTSERAIDVSILVNGEQIEVLKTNVAYFASATFTDNANVIISSVNKIKKAVVRPLNLGIKTTIDDNSISFDLKSVINLFIELDSVVLPIFFYSNIPEKAIFSATYYFKAGQIYETGELILNDNETIYIEGGAVVKGCISAKNASNIKIMGQGILDGSYYSESGEKRMIMLDSCTDIEIKDIIMIEPPSWMVQLANCNKIHIQNLKQIGEVVSSDGIDIVGSSNVLIENCMLRNNDDCIVIKGFEDINADTGEKHHWNANVNNVVVRRCVFVNAYAGNALEIGHELQMQEVSNIEFSDCDILSVHGHGAAFSIHAGDRALVHNVVYENIRVEHYYDKLVDFRIICSQFNKDETRGQIRDILLKDIYVKVESYNPGYSISVIGGYNENYTVENITFENFYLNKLKVMNADDLDLFTKNTNNIVFR